MYMDRVEYLRLLFVALVQDRLLATDRPRSTGHAEGEVKGTKVGIGFLEEVPTSYTSLVEDKLDLVT